MSNYSALKAYGKTVSPQNFDALVDIVKRNAITPCPDYTIDETATGTRLKLKKAKGSFTIGAESCPFDIMVSGSGSGLSVQSYPGTVNQSLPSNIFSWLTVGTSGTKYLTVDVTTDGKRVTATEMAVGTSAPEPPEVELGAGPTSLQVLIGVVVNGKPFKTWGCGNVNIELIESLRVDKTSPTTNELPYESYYSFKVTQS